MYVWKNVSMYEKMYVFMYVWKNVCMFVCIYVKMYVCMYGKM